MGFSWSYRIAQNTNITFLGHHCNGKNSMSYVGRTELLTLLYPESYFKFKLFLLLISFCSCEISITVYISSAYLLINDIHSWIKILTICSFESWKIVIIYVSEWQKSDRHESSARIYCGGKVSKDQSASSYISITSLVLVHILIMLDKAFDTRSTECRCSYFFGGSHRSHCF